MNQTFTDKEQLLARIAAIEADIPALDMEIAHAERVLESLREKRQLLICKSNAHRQLLAPVTRLPNEILSEIFRLHYYGVRAVNSWVLCQVCRTWRAVAMDTPELWSRVNLTFPTIDLTGAAIAQLQQVSPRFPARLTIAQPKKKGRPLAETFHRFPGAIRSIVIKDIDSGNYHNLFPASHSPRALMSRYTQLRELRVCSASPYDPDVVGRGNFNPESMGLPWTQLTCIDFDYGMEFEMASAFLGLCTNLLECSIALIYTGLEDEEITEPKVITHLHTLCIVILCETDFSHFFDTLTIPALKDLTLMMHGHGQDFQDSGLMDLKARSSLDLTHFTAVDAVFHAQPLIDSLQDMPSLSFLKLVETEYCITPPLTDALTVRPGRPQLLAPNLLEFVFASSFCSCDEALGLEWIIDMLESRCLADADRKVDGTATAYPSPIRRAHMSFNKMVNAESWQENWEIQRRVDALREKGMTVMLE